ncbi:MAG: hypothetical protein ABEJ06_06600 [Haloarculaceae archaeon]
MTDGHTAARFVLVALLLGATVAVAGTVTAARAASPTLEGHETENLTYVGMDVAVHADGDATVTIGYDYLAGYAGGDPPERSDYRYGDRDSAAFSRLENVTTRFVSEFAAQTAETTGREMAVEHTGSELSYGKTSGVNIWIRYEWTNFARVADDGAVVVTEPMASHTDVFKSNGIGLTVEAPGRDWGFIDYNVYAMNACCGATKYPMVLEYQNQTDSYDGFRAVALPESKFPSNATPTPTATPAATTTPVPDAAGPSAPTLGALGLALVVVALVGVALRRRRD